MLPESAITLLLQVPLAGIVVLVVVLFLKYLEKAEDRNRQFIKEQREANNIATARLAEEIKIIAQEVGSLKTLMIEHNTRSEDCFDRLNRLNRAGASRRPSVVE